MPQPAAFNLTNYNILAAAVTKRDSDVIQMVAEAVQDRRVVLAFQPVIGAKRGNIAFYEALARVLEPSGRIIPAGEFIADIEDTEIGRKLDCRALELGLNALRQTPGLRLSVNMSARSIGNPEWTEILDRCTFEDCTIAERLILEITENSAMTVPEAVSQFIATWRQRGVTFALDDFGAGHTAFRYFKQFQFEVLKIDGQFSRNIAQDADNQVLTKSMLSIAEHFDMITVSEHVENAADAQMLASLGVPLLQGYHFGAPVLRPEWEPQAQVAGTG